MAEYWIETAKECFNIGNFNTLASILDGLNTAAVSRLSKTVSCWSFTDLGIQAFKGFGPSLIVQ